MLKYNVCNKSKVHKQTIFQILNTNFITLPWFKTPSRKNKSNKYIHKESFKSNNYTHFENSNPHISSVNDEYGQLLHQPINKSKIKASIVKINNYRYNALKPNKDKYIQLKELLKQFTHKELTDHLLGKVIY